MTRVDSDKLREALKLYFIFGSQNCLKNPLEVLQEAICGGVTCFQFREKGKGSRTGTAKLELARQLQKICRGKGIPFIVNDDIDLALELDADGVHIGQDDGPADEIRKKIGDRILGVSAHTMEEVRQAIVDGADYLGLGPIYPTATKEDAEAVQGTTLIEEVRKQGIDIPLVGIGGIKAHNAKDVVTAGTDGISVITAISHAESIALAARQLLETVEHAKL